MIVCDDDLLSRQLMAKAVASAGFSVTQAADGLAALAALERCRPVLALVDLVMPRMDGLTLLREMERRNLDVPVIVVTGSTDVSSAVAAVKTGVSDFLIKPLEVETLIERVRRHARKAEDDDAPGPRPRFRYAGLMSSAKPMCEMFQQLKTLETVDVRSVLVTGESGTGKELVARAIHARGPRRDRPFVEVDSTTLPATLVESTLFGHERGAFTDAKVQRAGLLEAAEDGVVFLDEVGELPLEAQAKLLRALENRQFKRVGGTTNLPMRATVVAATHRDLAEEVRRGRFREDLFYRLAVVPIHLPPLRQRPEDIEPLVHHFIDRFDREFDRSVRRLADDALEVMLGYNWPGNVRQLRNIVERAIIFAKSDELTADLLPPSLRYPIAVEHKHPFALPLEGIDLEQAERSFIEQAMARTGGRKTEAARLLGVSRFVLRNRLVKYGLE